MKKTYSKFDIIKEISSKTGLTQEEVKTTIDKFMENVISILEEGGRIELRNFGVFEVKLFKERKARDMKRNKTIIVPAKNKVIFKSSKKLTSKINPVKEEKPKEKKKEKKKK